MSYLIAPSILSADFCNLGQEVADVVASGADLIHFDVMDNHYVPNLTFGPGVCASLKNHLVKKNINAKLDVHLMTEPVDELIKSFITVGADWISFHPEATKHIHRSMSLIKDANKQVGLALNPGSSLCEIKPLLNLCDFVLVMSVNPGFANQKFISETIHTIKQLKKLFEKHNIGARIEVDGGINEKNIGQIAQAGADTFVAGSAIFGKPDTGDTNKYNSIIGKMRMELALVNK